MKANIVTTFGDPTKLRVVELDDPVPGPGQVLVRVRAAALNRIDLSIRNGNLARAGLLAPASRYHLGWDVAGVVEQVGPSVSRFAVGDAVIGLRDILSDGGTHAEYVVLAETAVAPAPHGLSFELAAALPLAGLTAERSLRLAGVRAGDWLLVTGAAGGVGRLAVELAGAHGVRVIAAADARDSEDLLASGAEHVLPRDADLPREVRKVVPQGVDAVIDGAVLGVTAHESLRGGGTFVALVAPFAPPPLRATTVVVQEVYADGGTLATLSTLLASAQVSVRVAETFSLDDAAKAHELFERGGVRGRIVLVP